MHFFQHIKSLKLGLRIIMRKYFFIIEPVFRHHIRAVLAHAKSMPIAGYGENKDAVLMLNRERRASQGKELSHFSTADFGFAKRHSSHSAAFVKLRVRNPLRRIVRKYSVGL